MSIEHHSIKPFLLDAILGWCGANKITPILVVRPHPDWMLPDHLLVSAQKANLAFNIGPKAVMEKQITTQHISFTTFFRHLPQPEKIILPVGAWVAVRVQETTHHFDLSFPEHLSKTPQDMWPQGINLNAGTGGAGLSIRSDMNTGEGVQVAGAGGRHLEDHKPRLRLVRSDGNPIED